MGSEVLGSRYLLDECIGQGGMGVVWRGRDHRTGARYAIKVLRPEYAADPASVGRFVRERTALLSLRHPNVVAIHDMIMEGDRLALVMDLISGGDLASHQRRRGGKLSPQEATDVAAQIADALAAAHAAGIVHRDLKPANVLVDGDRFALADFGIARIADHPSSTTKGTVIGTVAYMAPEVIAGHEPTAACDVYALGITLHELLTGTPPFTGNVAAILHDHVYTLAPRPVGIPDSLWKVTSDCLDKDPAGRPTAAALAQTLHALAQSAYSAPARDQAPEQSQGHRPETVSRTAMPYPAQNTRAPAVPRPSEDATHTVRRPPTQDQATWGQLQVDGPENVSGDNNRWLAVPAPSDPNEPPKRADKRSRPGRRIAAIAAAAAVLIMGGIWLALNGSGSSGSASKAGTSTDPVSAGLVANRTPPPRTKPTASVSRTATMPDSTSAPSPEPGTAQASSVPSAQATQSATSPAPPSSGSSGANGGSQSACSATKTQTGVSSPKQTRACIQAEGSSLTLEGWLSTVPSNLPADEQEQVELVLATPSGDVGRYLSGDCSPGTCSWTITVTEPAGKYEVRADFVIGGSDQFQGDDTAYVTVS
jgi:serine/threonine protein kinase, bacterial